MLNNTHFPILIFKSKFSFMNRKKSIINHLILYYINIKTIINKNKNKYLIIFIY